MNSDAAQTLFERYACTRDPVLRQELIVRHLALVSRLARRFRARGQELDDLIQVGYIGLIHAIDRYDPSAGSPFLAFALPTILGEIRHYFRDRSDGLRIPRRLRDLRARRTQVVERLAQDLARTPSTADIAAAMPGEESRDLEVAAEPMQPLSLDAVAATAEADGGRSLNLAVSMEDPELARSEDRAVLRQVLSRLSPRERIVLYLRFYEGLSQAQAATRLGMSQMHVSRWEHRALDKLRRALEP